MIADLAAGGLREKRWLDWQAGMEEMNATLSSLYAELANHRLASPPFPVSEVKEHLEMLADELKRDGEPGFLFFLGRGRKAKYLYQHDWLDGHPIRTAADVEVFRKFVDYQELRYTLRRIYNAPSRESGLPEIDVDARRFPYEMDENLTLFKKIRQLVAEVESLKQSPYVKRLEDEVFYQPDDLEKELLESIQKARIYPEHEAWKENLRKLVVELQETNDREDAHPVVSQMICAIEELDEEKYTGLLQELTELSGRRQEALRLKDLLGRLAAVLPETKARLEERLGVEYRFPENWEEAFQWRKLKSWVDASADMDTELIRRRIAEEQSEQSSLINKIVKNSTWANLLENMTEREKAALSAWKSSIKRYGKGTGRHARYYLKTARENMKVAQTAIPVWIMPINQVLENFPATNEKFDVIILDESSQCDIYSANVLLRGKKIIVVGDEEQISPQSIGVRFDDVRELGRRYLKEIPNAALLDGNTSLYELAEGMFPKGGKLMLREHFRSVKEIIQFSNRLSYDGEMVPMRVPIEKERFNQPVIAVKVEDGENDESEKDVNAQEVDRIVEDIVRMMGEAKYDGQTFGVISLQGQKQHRLLETKIRNAIGDEEFVRRRILCGTPYTLQGDERDIIFLSMVVAPNRRFRAFTGMADKQRFNVAASRAKNQMRLYHSVDLEDLNTDDLRSRLLGYCRQTEVEVERSVDPESLCGSGFELDVLHDLQKRGYLVKPKVRVGRYVIDFVIEGENDRLAVECEGDKWQGAERHLAEFRRRQSLERVGWEFRSIRGNEFYFNREETMAAIQLRLEEKGIDRNGKP
ncbi:AAA domain-containing protein [Bhargavaea ullalensis]|uniref:Very-short-patch-repair endonuclease n=1 Tax=Bhargavaea ullalensis TaxID=1265685 RepID=A0ABV2GAA5_9BACL